jgi:hypothetical protein
MRDGDVFQFGPTATVDVGLLIERAIPTVDASFTYAFELTPENRTRVLAAGGWGDRPLFLEMGISGRDGFRTLPFGEIRADRYGSLAVAHDLPIVRGDWGAFTVTSFFEWGAYDATGVDPVSFYGPGGGVRVYIRRLAIPALGVDVGYNLATKLFAFSIAVGGRM